MQRIGPLLMAPNSPKTGPFKQPSAEPDRLQRRCPEFQEVGFCLTALTFVRGDLQEKTGSFPDSGYIS